MEQSKTISDMDDIIHYIEKDYKYWSKKRKWLIYLLPLEKNRAYFTLQNFPKRAYLLSRMTAKTKQQQLEKFGYDPSLSKIKKLTIYARAYYDIIQNRKRKLQKVEQHRLRLGIYNPQKQKYYETMDHLAYSSIELLQKIRKNLLLTGSVDSQDVKEPSKKPKIAEKVKKGT